MLKKLYAIFFIITVSGGVFAQQKYALVIGNGAYTGNGMSRLANPVNDANDIAAALQGLGFTVDKVLDANRVEMERAITRLKDRLSGNKNTYGFFYYAGHGIQFKGENYLIPVGADISDEEYLPDRAVSMQGMLGILTRAGNDLNMIVLDACRDNPFSRGGTRGLSLVSAPSGSIIMYATAANSTAADSGGNGRNGLFTGHLLTNLKTPGLSVFEVFDKTMGDVSRVSGGKQHPELSLRFSGAASAYLGSKPASGVVQPPAPPVQPNQNYKVGDTGPAGGIIFYDKGNFSNGWRYLEAAPVETEFTAQWGADKKDVAGTATVVGSGKRNTEIIVDRLRGWSETGRAAQLCASLDFDGYKDWFLPSYDELELMYKNLKQKNLGNFGSGWYWSSSQALIGGAFYQHFSNGIQNFLNGNSSTYSVRAIRAF